MKNKTNYNLAKVSIGFLMFGLIKLASGTPARALDLNYTQMVEVLKLAKAINAVNPRLEDSKYIEYAVGIYRASQKYSIDPRVMIAITQQETGFRENLPEGAAGEIGICQIRKMWLKNPKFKVEFKKQTTKDMMKPAKNFLFAAWILKNLKDSSTSGTLPFWSFYNAMKFEPRFKYFLAVNRNIATLRRHEPAEAEPALALNTAKPEVVVDDEVEVQAPSAWKSNTKKTEVKDLRANVVKVEKAKLALTDEEAKVPARWIPEALKKLAKQQQKNEEVAQGYDAGSRGKKMVSPSVMRAAAELEVSPWETPRAIQD